MDGFYLNYEELKQCRPELVGKIENVGFYLNYEELKRNFDELKLIKVLCFYLNYEELKPQQMNCFWTSQKVFILTMRN